MSLEKKVLEGQMKEFIGTKKIKAVETTKQEYCDYRGWKVPEDEDPIEEIYLVEYEVDPLSKPNHTNHRGYISMSPKHVFEDAYKPASTFLDRLHIEANELYEKIEKLTHAIEHKLIPESETQILKVQLDVMRTYFGILASRINKATN